MPDLNNGRQCHATCATADAVFVFCGFAENDISLSSIEMLEPRQKRARWQLIDVSSQILTPRFGLGVATLNPFEIAIMGGYQDDDDE